MLTYADLMADFRLTFTDPWGSTMSWLFSACDSLVFDHDRDAPPECRFRPSPLGKSNTPGELEADACAAADPDALYKFAKTLNRYANALKRAGKDY